MNTHLAIATSNQIGALPLDQETQPREGIDAAATIRAIWSAVYRNWKLIAAIVSATTLAGIVLTLLMTPVYRATTSVQIDQQATKVLATDDTAPENAWQDADRFLQTQVDVLTSRAIAVAVMNNLELDKDDQFLLAMKVKPLEEPVGSLDLKATKREQVLSTLSKHLNVTLPRSSRVVDISFESPNPAIAMRVANSFAANFISANLQRKFDASAYARNFLSQQLIEAKRRLEDSERATLEYARQAGLIDASAGVNLNEINNQTPRSLVTSNLVQLDNAHVVAQAVRLQAQQRYAQAMRTPLMSLPEVISNPAITQLSALRAQAQAAYDQDRMRRKTDFPAMQQAAAQIASYDSQITGLARSVRDSLRDQYLTALKQEQALVSSVNSAKTATLSEQERSVRYNILKRETDTDRTMYEGLLERYKEVSAAAGISANNIALIDTADLPGKPVKPRPLLNLVASLMMGFLLAGLAILFREKLDDVIRSPDDIQRKLGLTFLNSVPILRPGESPHEELADPRSPLSEAYAALRTSLELVDGNGLPKSLLFTSSRQSEGKSTSAFAVARNFAQLGRKVVLVDSDLRKPSLHRQLGGTNSKGLSSLLARHSSLDDVVQPTDIANLTFISSGPLPPNPAELLSGASLPAVLDELSRRFDLVIIDGPPVLGLADAVLLATNTAATVFIVEANGSHHGHAKAAIRRLHGSNIKIIGALLTKYDARKIGYGEAYGYYSYNYGADAPSTIIQRTTED